MNIYNLIDDILLSEDLMECGKSLISFAELAIQEKNKASIVREYKKRLVAFNTMYMSMHWNKPDFYYITGRNAVQQFICSRTNPDLPPVKFVESIAKFGQELLDNHLEPSGRYVSEESVREIISYVNKVFDFTRKAYGEYVPTIILNNNSHKHLNGFQPISNMVKSEGPEYIFLYHVMPGAQYSPEYVLLHELGHVVQMCCGSVRRPPDSFYSILSEKALDRSDSELCENFADTFAMAVMHDSPFEKYSPFSDFPPEIRQLNKDYINSLLR